MFPKIRLRLQPGCLLAANVNALVSDVSGLVPTRTSRSGLQQLISVPQLVILSSSGLRPLPADQTSSASSKTRPSTQTEQNLGHFSAVLVLYSSHSRRARIGHPIYCFLRLLDTLEAMTETGKNVLLAAPRGYCAGVDRAVETVEKALEKYGAPIYVRKQIVHNRYVVESWPSAASSSSKKPPKHRRVHTWFSLLTASRLPCVLRLRAVSSSRSMLPARW